MEVDNEDTLKTHIRKLLLHYSLTHLTTNYVTHTRREVSELLSDCLSLVPDEDPNFLTLPVEPFDALSRMLRLKDVEPYKEKWNTDPESREFVKNTLLGSPGKPVTDRCWRAEDDTPSYDFYRHMTPILTIRAIRQTPHLGATSSSSSGFISSLKKFDASFVQHFDFKQISDECISELEVPALERDRLLGVRPTIDKETQTFMVSLLHHIPGGHPHPKNSIQSPALQLSSMVSAFLHGQDSPPLTSVEYTMSPPVFLRQRSKADITGIEHISDISTLMKKVKAEEDEIDLNTAHMHLVDGWNVMAPPPTSQGAASDTPSLDPGSQSSQIELDELFALTPPQQSRLSMNAKMDEYIIARNRKPGGGRKSLALDEAAGQRLGTFLPSLLPPVSTNFASIPPNLPLHRSPPVSLLGLPASPDSPSTTVQDGLLKKDNIMDVATEEGISDNAGLNVLVSRLCTPINGQNAEDWVMMERMDEKEALMMEVPMMTEHTRHRTSPACSPILTSLRSLIVPKPINHAKPVFLDTTSTNAYLKKVPGVQSLNIELSWRPFNFGTSMPHIEELAGVERGPSLDLKSGADKAGTTEVELQNLVSLSEAGADSTVPSARLFGDPPVDWTPVMGDQWNRFDVVLTRAERQRLTSAEDGKFDDSGNAIPRLEEVVGHFEPRASEEPLELGSPTRPNKRRKLAVQISDIFIPDALEASRDLKFVLEPDDDELSMHAMSSPTRTQVAHSLSEHESVWFIDTADTDTHASQKYGARPPSTHLSGSCRQDLSVGQVASDTEPWRSENFTGLNKSDAIAGRTPHTCANASSSIAEATSVRLAQPHASSPLGVDTLGAVLSCAPCPSRNYRSEKASAQRSLFNFMNLRGKTAHNPGILCSSSPEPQPQVLMDMPLSLPPVIPDELIDNNTLNIPEHWISPLSRYRYIASLELIQKSVLVKHLTSADCNVELVERDASAMNGVDLVIDINTALLFVPLSPLPASGDALAQKLAELSWDFAVLVVVFEAFSSSWTYRMDKTKGSTGLTPYAFSPAVIKAIRKLKRTIRILEATETGNKRRDTQIQYAYAMNVGEAARLARIVGDMSKSPPGELQDTERQWLTDDFHEGEMDLAQIKGMNVFAASMILSCIELNPFIEMEPGTRLQLFSEMVGEQRIVSFNEELAKRLAHVAYSSPSLTSPAGDTTRSPFAPMVEPFEDQAYHDSGYAEAEIDHEYYSQHRGRRSQDDGVQWKPTGLLMVAREERHNW